MNNKRIAIIIVNWQQYDLTYNCLLSLQKINFKDFQIILIDNESKHIKLNELKFNFKQIITFKNTKNLGFAAGNNIGIKYALENSYEYLMLLNNDTEVNKDFLVPLVNRLKESTLLGAVQPLILNFPNKSIIWNAGGKLNKFSGIVSTRFNNIELNISNIFNDYTDWISGCCILIKSDVLYKVGLLDEKFFTYYEDVDWSLRIKKEGYSLGFVRDSVIYHHGSSSSKNKQNKEGNLSAKVHYFNIRNHILLLKKHKNLFNFIGIIFFQIFKIVSYIFYFLIRLRFNKLGMVIKGLKDGIINK